MSAPLSGDVCLFSEEISQRDEAIDRNFLSPSGRVDGSSGQQRPGVHAQHLQALAQHLATLAKGCLGVSRTTEDVTLGGGTNADRATSNRIFASVRQPAKTDRRP